MKTSHNTILHSAVQAGDVEQVKSILLDTNSTSLINQTDQQGNTALKLASQGTGLTSEAVTYEVYEEIAKLLIVAGADVDIADEDGNTPLQVAVSWSNYDIFERIAFALIEAGADIHKTDQRGRTPLFFASYTNQKLALALLDRGADIHVKDTGNPKETMLCYALHKKFEHLFNTLLQKGATTTGLDDFVATHHESLSSGALQIYYRYQQQIKGVSIDDTLRSIQEFPKRSETWNKVCVLYSLYLQEKPEQVLDFERNLRADQIALGYAHDEFIIFRITLYVKLGNQEQLQQILKESFTYSRLYHISDSWRDSWHYLSDKEFEVLLNMRKQQYALMCQKYHCNAYASYKQYPIEKRPFIWFEEATLKKAKQKCAISGKKLQKGTQVYKFKNLNEFGRLSDGFFYADIQAFTSNPTAMSNKACYENNRYTMEQFAFYWQVTTKHPWCRRFWYHVDAFSLQETLQLLASPLIAPAIFKHRYGKFLDNDYLVKREHEQMYNTEYVLSSGCGRDYLNIWHALIKCGYLDEIITALPTLPDHVPYLLLCFDIPEVKQKTANYLQIEGIVEVMDIALKSYAHTNERDVKRLIEFSLSNPKAIESIAELLRTYELHLYNVYAPSIDWYCQAFSRFSTAKGTGLLDFLIPYPTLLHPLTLLLENGGELVESAYSDSEIFFIRTVLMHTSLFNPSDIEKVYHSLGNSAYQEGICLSGIEEKVYNKMNNVLTKLVKIIEL